MRSWTRAQKWAVVVGVVLLCLLLARPRLTPAEPTTQLPDLIVDRMYLEMEGRAGDCVLAYAPYEIRVVVRNTGDAAAPSFVVQLNGVQQSVTNGLAAGQSVELHFPGTVPSGQYTAFIDPAGLVAERDESGNLQVFSAPTPTPPPICTPAPTNSPTATP